MLDALIRCSMLLSSSAEESSLPLWICSILWVEESQRAWHHHAVLGLGRVFDTWDAPTFVGHDRWSRTNQHGSSGGGCEDVEVAGSPCCSDVYHRYPWVAGLVQTMRDAFMEKFWLLLREHLLWEHPSTN